jgi:hypothetical protein
MGLYSKLKIKTIIYVKISKCKFCGVTQYVGSRFHYELFFVITFFDMSNAK